MAESYARPEYLVKGNVTKDMGGPEILGMMSVYLTMDPDKHPAGQIVPF